LGLHAALLVAGLTLFTLGPGLTPTANVTPPLPPAWDRTPDPPAAVSARWASARFSANGSPGRFPLDESDRLSRLDR
jgi:hypothetical protein